MSFALRKRLIENPKAMDTLIAKLTFFIAPTAAVKS